MGGMVRPTRPERSSIRTPGQRSGAAGRDPARDLATHNAYDALDSAGALFKTGMTGTNVMDVVIGLVRIAD